MLIKSIMLVVTIPFLGTLFGCASNFGTYSKYQPSSMTKSGYIENIEMLKGVQNKFVNDELGTYYYKFYNDNKYACFFNYHEDADNISNLMSKGKGLVEPIYIPNTDLSDITPNWELTTKLINELKDHGFNVLPIEQTKVYGTYLKSKVDGDIRDSSKSSTSQASGVIRDNKYITEVLAKISSFDYLISFNEAALYGYHTMGIIQKKGPTLRLRISPSLMITGLQQTNGINFKSKDMLININNEGYEKCGTCYNTMTIRCNDVPRRITYLSELHGGGGFTNSFDTTDKYLFDYYELSTSLLWEVKEKLKLSGSIKSKTLSE